MFNLRFTMIPIVPSEMMENLKSKVDYRYQEQGTRIAMQLESSQASLLQLNGMYMYLCLR